MNCCGSIRLFLHRTRPCIKKIEELAASGEAVRVLNEALASSGETYRRMSENLESRRDYLQDLVYYDAMTELPNHVLLEENRIGSGQHDGVRAVVSE